MSKVSLSTLADKLSEKSGLSTTEAELFIRKMFDVCHQGLEADKQVKMRWLGTFKVTSVKDRESVDVNTGERIMIEGRDKISFTPDNILKEIVNKPFAQFETVVVNDGVDFEEIDKKFDAEIEENDKKFEAENEDRDKKSDTEIEDSVLTEQAQMDTTHEVAEENLTANESPVETSEELSVELSVEPSVESPIINGVVDFLNTPETAELTSDVIIIGEDVTLQNEAESPASTSVEEVGVVTNAFHQEVEDTTSSFAPNYVEAETNNQETNRVEATEKVEANTKDTEKEVEVNTDANDKVEARAESSDETEITAEAETEITAEAEAELRRRHFILPKWAVAVASIVVLALIAGMGWLAFNYGQLVAQRDNLAMKLDKFEANNVAPKPQPKSQEEILREKAREDSIRMLQASEALKAAEQAEKDSIAKSKEEQSEKELLAKEQLAKEKLAKEKLEKEKLAKEKLAQEKQAKEKLEKEKQTKAKLAAEAKASSTKPGNTNKYDHDARVRTGAYRIVGVAQTVTVGEGQSLAAISKRYLGPGMECYIEAINGTSSVKSGQIIKIPKLELKKKTK